MFLKSPLPSLSPPSSRNEHVQQTSQAPSPTAYISAGASFAVLTQARQKEGPKTVFVRKVWDCGKRCGAVGEEGVPIARHAFPQGFGDRDPRREKGYHPLSDP